MIIISRRRIVVLAIAVLLLTLLGWFFWPFVSGPGQMQGFCSSLPAGSSVEQVKIQAAQHGYRVSSLIEGRSFVHDPKSFGRFICNMQFGSDGLISAVYSFND